MAAISVRRVALLAATALVLIGCAGFVSARIERNTATSAAQRVEVSQELMTAMLDQETASRGFFETGSTPLLAPWYSGSADYPGLVRQARDADGGDTGLIASLDGEARRAAAWHTVVAAEIQTERATQRAPTIGQAISDELRFGRLRAANLVYVTQLNDRRDSSMATANWLAAGVLALLAIVLVLSGVFIVRRNLRRHAADGDRQRELRELLQVSATVSESQQLLVTHVEQISPSWRAAVLNCDEIDDRLEVAIGTNITGTPLQGIRTDQLNRRSCIAVRLSRTYERRPGAEPLVHCDVCGRLAGAVACEPLLVGGRVIGAVLVAHETKIPQTQREQIRESVIQAAPILANQRNLQLAEWRAATDALTGLPNRRSADDTLRRMAAHAGRTLTPLGVVMLDLDCFKQINDRHGHEQGDKVLATVGRVLAANVRASDFVARYGGEAFIALLPDTDRRGSVKLAEKIRLAVQRAEVPVVGNLTGSLGVAALPEDAVEPERLLRRADRALYAAKARGRNRVVAAEPSTANRLPGPDGDDLRGDDDPLSGGDPMGGSSA